MQEANFSTTSEADFQTALKSALQTTFRNNFVMTSIAALIMVLVIFGGASSVSASSTVLKKGMQGSSVTSLQKNLISLGYLDTAATGYFGSATEAAVKELQRKNGCSADGVAGSATLRLISNLNSRSGNGSATVATTSASKKQSSYMLPWFSKVSNIFSVGTIATVYDIGTGLSFKVKRTYGHNHADCEALTATDTATMKKIFGGSWNWSRRAVIINVGGTKIAASIAGMPHAGLEKYSANSTVSSRSAGYGRGNNMDAVKGNNMNGVFDIHFYGSRTHATNRSDSAHQSNIRSAAKWALNHY